MKVRSLLNGGPPVKDWGDVLGWLAVGVLFGTISSIPILLFLEWANR